MLVKLEITAESPLAFPERKLGTQFQRSHSYVPGSTIYGALGQAFAADFDEQLFRDLRCHNAYPAHPGDEWVRPLPSTALQPKGSDGLTNLYDALVGQVCWEQLKPSAMLHTVTDADGRPFEAAKAQFYTLCTQPTELVESLRETPRALIHTVLGHVVTLHARNVTQRVLTRVAINRRRGTAEDQLLYSPLAISEVSDHREGPCAGPQRGPTRFLGSVVLPTGHDSKLEQRLREIRHLGGRQTTGLGLVTVTPEAAVAETAGKIAERIAALTARFQARAARYRRLSPQREWDIRGSIFTANLLSHAILLEQGWLPTNQLSPAALCEATGIKARLLRAFTSTAVVGGWQVLWQRPKPTAVAVTMGSLFVFQTDAVLDAEACEPLARLQLQGIGERRAEGFGQLRICDEFHLLERQTSEEFFRKEPQ